MDINSIRIICTLIVFVAFIGIWVWAWLDKNRGRFEQAALIPFEHERSAK